MAYTVVYHPEVKAKDVPKLNRDVARGIQRAVENRLAVEPQRYGESLRRTLKGYWKLRVGDYRVVFKIARNEVWIFAIMRRRDVYQRIEARLSIQISDSLPVARVLQSDLQLSYTARRSGNVKFSLARFQLQIKSQNRLTPVILAPKLIP